MRSTEPSKIVGILSDTHGLLRPEVTDGLQGADLILHAGDIGSKKVLDDLNRIAPVIAIRGNVDTGSWASEISPTATVSIGGVSFFLIHDIADVTEQPVPDGTNVVLYGHSHKPEQQARDTIIYLNPGSAGPQRFSLPIGFVMARISIGKCSFKFVRIGKKHE